MEENSSEKRSLVLAQATEKLGDLLEGYEGQTWIRSLIQLIPFGLGSAFDVAASGKAFDYRRRRMRVFFDELASGAAPLSEEVIESEDFLHCYFRTVEAADRSRVDSKIRRLARLLRCGFSSTELAGVDEFEELLASIDSVSDREFSVLVLLRRYEISATGKHVENELARVGTYWHQFRHDAIHDCGVRRDELNAFLMRIERSGLYARIAGSYYDYDGNSGKTTPIFHRLEQLLRDYEGEGFDT